MTITTETPTAEEAENPDAQIESSHEPHAQARTRRVGHALKAIRRSRAFAYGVLTAVALLLTVVLGYLTWNGTVTSRSDTARAHSVAAATESTIALLSYTPETVQRDLEAAQSGMTGDFLDSYTSLTHDVVIPGAKQQQISAVATVPAAASVSATEHHAVVLLFVNQEVTIGQDAPTNTASSVRVTLDKIGDRWLISDFTPV